MKKKFSPAHEALSLSLHRDKVNNRVKSNKTQLDDDLDPMKQIWENLPPGSLTVIAGRPSTGKTTLITQFLNYRKSYPYKTSRLSVLVFTLGQKEDVFIKHYVSHMMDTAFTKLMSNSIDDYQIYCLEKAVKKLKGAGFLINSELELEPKKVFERCKEVLGKEKYGFSKAQGIDYVVIDGVSQNYSMKFSNSLAFYFKKIALDLNAKVIVSSDVNPEADLRECVTPSMYDLDKVNHLSSVAEKVIFISRDGSYSPDNEENSVETVEYHNEEGRIEHTLCKFNGVSIGFR